MKYVDVFTTTPFHGNPAGIVTDADDLSPVDMKKISGDINMSESAYVSTGRGSSPFRLRYFTQKSELDISGHATIAACFALIEEGRIALNDGVTSINFDTNIGDVPLYISFRKKQDSDNELLLEKEEGNSDSVKIGDQGYLDKIMTRQSVKSYQTAADITPEEIAEILQINPGEIHDTDLPMERMATGLEHLVIPVMHKETLLNMKPDLIKLSLLNKKHGIQTNDIFSLEAFNERSIAYSRHFAPAIGLWEDQGSANAAICIGTYMHRHGITTRQSMIFDQGSDRDHFSAVHVDIETSIGVPDSGLVGGVATTSIIKDVDPDKIEAEDILID